MPKLDQEMNTVKDDNPNENKGVTQDQSAGDETPEKDVINSGSTNSLTTLSPRTNPLENPVVLHHLFRICPVSILAPCRLVCNLWYDETLLTWRRKRPITITTENESIFLVQRSLSTVQLSSLRVPLKEFLEFSDKPENQCDTKPYRIAQIVEGRHVGIKSDDFRAFWNTIGSNLTALNLYKCNFTNIEEFRCIIFKCCPLLQYLIIGNCDFENLHSQDESDELEPLYGKHKFLKSLVISMEKTKLPVSWVEIFAHFQLLTNCELSYLRKSSDCEFENVVSAIEYNRHADSKRVPLKGLKICNFRPVLSSDGVSVSNFALAKELRLPLTDFGIKVDPELDQSFLKNTLEWLAPSAREIIFTQDRTKIENPTWFQNFPFGIQLNKLAMLILQENVCQNFTFLKFTPNLQSLAVYENAAALESRLFGSPLEAVYNTDKVELANVEMAQLVQLRLEYIVGNDDIQQLVKWMPNITELDLVLNNEQIDLVCEKWKKLTRLNVLGKLVTEVGLTGPEVGKNSKEVSIHPNLLNSKVQWLTTLEIKLTPISVFHLFLHQPNLQKLGYARGTRAPVERKDLDLASYERATQDKVVEQWVADNGNILGE